jgi:hypothetical protein
MRGVPLVLLAAALSACTASAPARGQARATVEGGAAPDYAGMEAAKAAFTRSQGPVTAVLQDASWIRLEPDPAAAEKRHPEYFAGLTVVDVILNTDHFARPTDEDYVLEDSTGVRVSARPKSYQGDVQRGFGPKHLATFTVAFPHALSKDVRWIRMTRQGPGGGSVQWDL